MKASSILFALLAEVFDIRAALSSSDEDSIDEEDLAQLESSLIEAAISMTLKLNDLTFRPFFAQLADLASASPPAASTRALTFYKFLSAFFNRFKVRSTLDILLFNILTRSSRLSLVTPAISSNIPNAASNTWLQRRMSQSCVSMF